MATSAASATGSDSNRAAYTRDVDSHGDSNRLRIDESTLSAFDLLLDLPIFENQVPNFKADSEIESVSHQEDEDDSRSDDEDSSLDENGRNTNLVAIPITPRIQETLKLDSERFENEDGKVDVERIRAVDTPHERDSHGKSTFEVNRESNSPQPIEALNAESVESLQLDVREKSLPETGKQTLEEGPASAPLLNRVVSHPSDQSDQDSHEVDVASESRDEKASRDRNDNKALQTDSLTRTSTIQLTKESKQLLKPYKRDVGVESTKPSTNATPVSNRRADRLEENRRGESPKNDSKHDQLDLAESQSSDGSLEIPSELALESEPIDSVSALDAFHTLSTSEFTDLSATLSEASPIQHSIASPIVNPGNIAAASTSASTAVLESNRDSSVNSIGGTQGTASLSASSASRTTTPSTGRASTLSPYQEHRVLQRVLKGLEQLDSGGGSVRLRLHPPELGSLQITLRVEAQQVSALVEVEHAAAREVLLTNLPQLQSRLAEQGLNVSQFDVQVVDPNQWSQGSSHGWQAGNGQGTDQNQSDSKRSSRYAERLRNQIDRVPSTDSNGTGQSSWSRKNGQLDVRF